MELLPFKQGAEARLFTSVFYGKPCIVKERFTKSYRHPQLDKSLTAQRMKAEVRTMLRCRTLGIPTPTIYFVNMETSSIYMEHVKDAVTLRQYIEDIQKKHPETFKKILTPLADVIGKLLAKMHSNNIVHGDLTTSNMLLKGESSDCVLVLIDFGLSFGAMLAEDKGVDLYVLERALLSTHPNTECLFDTILESYKTEYKKGASEVISKLDEIRLRGRKRTMVG